MLTTTTLEGSSHRRAATFVTLGIVATSVLGACGNANLPTATPSPTTGIREPNSSSAISPPSTSTTTTSTTTTSTTTTAATPSTANLGPGASGPAVLALQQRLASLGYWLGTPDGTFSDSTEQAVYALQKAAHITRDGIVGPVTEAALARGVLPQPRSTAGYVIEVDLQDDLLMFVTDGKLDAVLNTSTGGGYAYEVGGTTAIADTPSGIFRVYRQVDGMVTDSLGALWRPKFFDSGFAIHGDSSVPPNPVSHGCVRVSDEAIDWIWADNLAPLGTVVWVY
jgi:hypothetical protein